MPQALQIFLKDSRQFRYPIVLLLAWTATFAAASTRRWPIDGQDAPGLPLFEMAVGGLAFYLFPIAWCYLIAQVIHADALADHRQFWLTRPYHRGSLAAAKAMFVLAYLTVPLMLAQAVIVVFSGLPLWPHAAGLIWNQVLLTIALVLPAAAVAAMTSTLSQFVVGALLVPAVLFVSGVRFLQSWGGLGWTRIALAAVAVLGITLTVLLLQFARRRTSMSKRIAVFGAVAAIVLTILFPWQAAFAIQSRVTGEWDGTLEAELEAPVQRERPAGVPSRLRDGLQFYFRVMGLPTALQTVCEAREITIELPDGRQWATDTITRPSHTTPERQCAVGLSVPRWLFDATGDGVVTLRAVLYNTVFSEERVTNVPVGPLTPTRTDAGFCVAYSRDRYPRDRSQYLLCRTAFGERPVLQWSGYTGSGYSPFPGSLMLQPISERGLMSQGLTAIPVKAREPVGHVRMVVRAEDVRLRDYQFGR